jgi:hypothetical protein
MFGSFSLYHQEEDDLLQVLTFFLQNDTTKRAVACQSTSHPLGFAGEIDCLQVEVNSI